MTTNTPQGKDRSFREIPPKPETSNKLDIITWADKALKDAEHNRRVALANAMEDPEYATKDIISTTTASQGTVNKIARDMGVPPRPRGGHR
ncbi:hypothetical protein ACWFMI_23395 [Nocardiopsis terrae]|uniref:hypothetical protein n=1 Tax=Streptomyces sp. NPDC057554 TaxID=3350538 RepID=UPI0036BC835D